ncbi:M3 family metallopeptidase [Psychrobacillus sp.]|uniref:M3 family metallopeptidase n=1 Tax=Psychrobacillus sp. TaxID=1871623 RepID=UPI0028BF368B|nr:M3 family metallopeptidase [Psychrobacillus sp.]
MKSIEAPIRWNLNNIYNEKKSIENQLDTIKKTLHELESIDVLLEEKIELSALSEVIKDIETAESFYYCLTSEEINSSSLATLGLTITSLKSRIRIIVAKLDQKDNFSGESDKTRVSSFARETLKGYEDIYTQVRQNIRIKVSFQGEETEVTLGEAITIAMKHEDVVTRKKAFEALNNSLKKQSNIFSSIYNQIIGVRLNLYKEENKKDYLEESLTMNGISDETLQTMWDVVDDNLPKLTKFLEAKAKDSNKGEISWHELMSSSQDVPYFINFPTAINGLVKTLEKLDKSMADFVINAVTTGWVDAEQRSSKDSGGFCVPFIREGESRISLNYDNCIDSARILAHELGHAWHYKQIKVVSTLQFLEDRFEMTTAETASIFFETAFINNIIQETKDSTLKKSIIGWKIERSLNYLMGIRGAYLFEKQVYEKRLTGPLTADELEEISLQSQQEAYGNSLSNYDSFIWIKYVQFYLTDNPFYNYPYSFGFLFSNGLLDSSEKESEHFSQKFKSFLSQTGITPIEQLTKQYFNIDLTSPEFWQQSMQRILNDVELYLEL